MVILLSFIQTPMFVAEFRRLKLNDDDLRHLEQMLINNPEAGKTMARTGGVRKLRFAPPSKHLGKRGALRICYAWFPRFRTIGLFLIYPKNEKDTLTSDDEKVCRLFLQQLTAALAKG